MTQNLTLHDLFGAPFVVESQNQTFRFAPPTVLFFEKLLRTYNLRVVDVEHVPDDALSARLHIAGTMLKLMHVALDMAEPDRGWQLAQVADLVTTHDTLMGQYMDAFRTYMPQRAAPKKSRTPTRT
ncbi:hypothetical protein [Deinococcus kurensis]|uniref:hypothetical protein n=1 Tax=Deinococcus kurensis TaxID=2662757 RepID=UPI0012D2C01B|nr:hypothetical protein [Deinococcus kurensis]